MIVHGVEPTLDHYSCVVHLLSRAGLLQEALDFILKMSIRPNAVIWSCLLSSSRLHGNIWWIGIKAAESRLLLEPGSAATHVQSVSLYASVKRWNQVARVPEDESNTKVSAILDVLSCMVDHMRLLGYVPEMYEEEVDDAFF
ncbi:pathoproteinsis-related protein 1C-like [Hibiscus syriacus]|uniref:Pathoproteinsis-related protein 1C-like n=1 Tax=Hibiscus syriacus TaxID=106335 RepID=A0A6A3AGZ1_HIBSY|nr:pathoproteinsis-related protein 1C-like [Hibiscus syriacus]